MLMVVNAALMGAMQRQSALRWEVQEQISYTTEYNDEIFTQAIGYCASFNNPYVISAIVLQIVVLLWGVVLCYVVRNVPEEFAEVRLA